jgi:hypothetical protein
MTWVRVPKLAAFACAVQYCPTNESIRAPCAAFSPFDPLSRQFQVYFRPVRWLMISIATGTTRGAGNRCLFLKLKSSIESILHQL